MKFIVHVFNKLINHKIYCKFRFHKKNYNKWWMINQKTFFFLNIAPKKFKLICVFLFKIQIKIF